LLLITAISLAIGPAAAQDASPDRGAALYRQFCARCHGPNMVNPGVASTDLRQFPAEQPERFFQSVAKGKRNMPAWGNTLKPDEVQALWAYVLTRGKP
jgi:mono/diheme cytochrome c family protein